MQAGSRQCVLFFLFCLCWSMIGADASAAPKLKVLADFESADSLRLWSGAVEASRENATQGQGCLKIILERGSANGISSEKLARDWSGFTWFAMEIVSQERDPQILSLNFYDALADDERANVWSEAFLASRKILVNRGVNHIRILLDGMRTSADTRPMALDQIRRVSLSAERTGKSLTLFLDNLRLFQGDPKEERSSATRPEDSVLTVRNRFVEVSQISPPGIVPETKAVQETRQQAAGQLAKLRDAIEAARTQGLETIYEEIPLTIAELGLGIRPLLPWFNNDERKAELFEYVARSCVNARTALENRIIGIDRLPDTDDTQVPEPLVHDLPLLRGLASKDGFFVDAKGDPLYILSVHSPSQKLTRFFATPFQHIESYTVGGGSRWTIDDSPVYRAFHSFQDTKRIGWDGWCGHLIRDRHSMGGKKEEVVICLESEHIRRAIQEYIHREALQWKKNPNLLYNILAYELAYMCYCDTSQRMFREWLQHKHKDVDSLNARWKTNFRNFEEIVAPRVKSAIPLPGTNRAQWFDWAIFNQERFTNHLAWVKELVKQVDPATPISTGGSYNMLAGSDGTSGIDEELIINRVDDVILHEGGGSTIGMDLQLALARDRKPLCDPELSIAVKDLWPHMLHGKSVVQLWHWPAQPPAEFPHANASSYAHSWEIPLGDVEELLRTALDVRRLSRQIAAFSGIPAETAILYSKTSVVQIPAELMRSGSTPYLDELRNVYEATLCLDSKTTFISESLIKEGQAARYKVIFVPSATHVPREVAQYLLKFVVEGGTLVLSPRSLESNEYLERIDFNRTAGIEVQGLEGNKMEKQGELVQDYDQTFRRERQTSGVPELKMRTTPVDLFNGTPLVLQGKGIVETLVPTRSSKALATFEDGRPAIMAYPNGKGTIYRLATPLPPDQYASFADRIYDKAGVARPVRAFNLNGRREWGIELRSTRYQGGTLMYLVNHTQSEQQLEIRSANGSGKGIDLRTGQSVSLQTVALRPFQTRIIQQEAR